MKTLDPQIAEICRRVKITDYLNTKGIELIRSGNRWRCKCPLPGHDDHDPSCYIRTLPDGTELFKCFGCNGGGNIISLIAAMENEGKGYVVKKISLQVGLKLTDKFVASVRLEPLGQEVDEIFCDEQEKTACIAEMVSHFMQAHPTDDVVNKVSRMYQMLDNMTRLGDMEGIERCHDLLAQIVSEYQ